MFFGRFARENCPCRCPCLSKRGPTLHAGDNAPLRFALRLMLSLGASFVADGKN